MSRAMSYGPPNATSKALPGSARGALATPARSALPIATSSSARPVHRDERARQDAGARCSMPNRPCPAAMSRTRNGRVGEEIKESAICPSGCRHRRHHGRHAVRELDPHGVVGVDGALPLEHGAPVRARAATSAKQLTKPSSSMN